MALKVLETKLDVATSKVIGTEKSTGSSTRSSTIEDEREAVPHLHAKTFLTVFAVCLIYFSQVFNLVGAGAYARDISSVVGGSTETVWLSSSVGILTVVLSPPVSQAADYWGRRWLLLILTATGVIGSIIIARATSMPMAIAGEVVAGLSNGAQPLLHAVSSEVLPRRYRPHAQGAINVGASLGGFAALVIGGAMTRSDPEGFRNFWYMSAALYAVATALCFMLYHPPPKPTQLNLSNTAKLAKLDWVGYALLTAGLVLFSIGLSWSQNPYPWTDAHVLATFLIGVALIVGLAVYETVFKRDGMFHHGLFSQGHNFSIALLGVFIEGLVFFAANNYFPFEVSVLFQSDPLISGVCYGITFILYPISSVLAGAYSSHTKQVRLPTVVALGFFVIFNICMATITSSSSNAVWGFTVFLGIGLGTCLCTLVTVAQLSTPPELIAITSGLMISVRSLGGSVGVAIYNAIFIEKLSSNLSSKIRNAVVPLGLPPSSLPAFINDLKAQDTIALQNIAGSSPEIIGAGVAAMRDAYSIAFRYVWILGACFTLVAAIAALFLVDPVKEFNMHIDASVEKDEELYSE